MSSPSHPVGTRVPGPGALAPPTAGELQVWWARVPVGRLGEDHRRALAADLDAATVARLARFHRAEDSDRGLAAHALLRRLLAATTGVRPAAVVLRTRCGSCGSTAHGKPWVDVDGAAPVEFNLSHSGEVVCVALAPAGVAVGVDVEIRRAVDWAALRRNVFADAEWQRTEHAVEPDRARTDLWARKESAVKAAGHGLSLAFRSVLVDEVDEMGDGAGARGGLTGAGVSTAPTSAVGRAWTARLPGGAGSAAGHDLGLGDDVAAALAVHFTGAPGPVKFPRVQAADLRS